MTAAGILLLGVTELKALAENLEGFGYGDHDR
jgi:hypothetical protein